jgi:hypothetical protein
MRRVSMAFRKHEEAASALTTRRRGSAMMKSMPRRDEGLGVVAWSRLKGGLSGEAAAASAGSRTSLPI